MGTKKKTKKKNKKQNKTKQKSSCVHIQPYFAEH